MPTILLVEDNPGDARLITEVLRDISDLSSEYEVVYVERLSHALEVLQSDRSIDIILSDITLPDSRGVDTLKSLNDAAVRLPIIFMTGTNDEALAISAINFGAQDYLLKGKIDSELLSKTLRYATERQKFQNDMNTVLAEQKMNQQRIELLAEQKRQLIKLNHSKDDFISIASHQLRTPASAVKQFVGMVIEGFAGEVPEQQLSLLRRAYDSNERQLNVISELLKTAQLDSSKIKLNFQKVELNELIKNSIAEMQSAIDLRNQQLIVNLESKRYCEADENELQLVITNVLENASKYTESGKSIIITMTGDDDRTRISIKDQGVGISKQHMKTIFDKFSRIDNELSDTVQGSGLGLYWVKRIIRLHKGTIKVNSVLGEGSEFILEIPCHG
jgi:signal transduction histidine kinase